jgi:hypothetical protein
MLRVGRPRKSSKDLPLGVYAKKGRFYVSPQNTEMRRIFEFRFPGKSTAPLGADKNAARKLWVKLFVEDGPRDSADAGTVGELIKRYQLEITPKLPPKTRAEHDRYCVELARNFGARPYARSEAEASSGDYLRSMHVTQYLRSHADQRPVAVNRAIQCLCRVFRLSKTLWGYTEYNPCLQIEYNVETPRSQYLSDDAFMRVYASAPPVLQIMMDLAQMHAARRGMLLKATLACIVDDGLLLPLNKKKRTDVQRYQKIMWTDDLREKINRALELRKTVRGGQREVADLATAPLFLTRKGTAYSETAFNSIWYRARKRAGFAKHEFHFHDIKAKSMSDSPNAVNAMERGGHVDLRMAKKVYLRKPTEVIPLASVSAKKKA